jgi:hypothetical protein
MSAAEGADDKRLTVLLLFNTGRAGLNSVLNNEVNYRPVLSSERVLQNNKPATV